MKKIFNFFITILILWIGNIYFHEHVQIIDTKTLLIASILMVGMDYLLSLAMMISVLTIPLVVGCFTTILLLLVAIIFNPIKLYLLNTYLDGFSVTGFWTYIALSCVLGIFTLSNKSNNTSNENSE